MFKGRNGFAGLPFGDALNRNADPFDKIGLRHLFLISALKYEFCDLSAFHTFIVKDIALKQNQLLVENDHKWSHRLLIISISMP